MRWYMINSVRGKLGVMDLEWSEHVVQACGLVEAFDKVRSLGWWPVHLIDSSWSKIEVCSV